MSRDKFCGKHREIDVGGGDRVILHLVCNDKPADYLFARFDRHKELICKIQSVSADYIDRRAALGSVDDKRFFLAEKLFHGFGNLVSDKFL